MPYNIISLNAKLREARDKKDLTERRRKLAAVRNALLEARRPFKCEKCHQPIGAEHLSEDGGHPDLKVPFLFCPSCSEEYLDYIRRLQGQGDPACYWRNEAWLELWKRWLDYQGTVDRYLKSNEFKQLLEELKLPDPYR
ncbi:hypothetical protein DENIS_4004 [Desulfonema ishimotonii]|uniref:Uncharacterized protein n=1 Tax=Desulfonema ishimotonii TaxID=45657 RepID=A0A401G1C7_9BACT|nr:hypothetical protein [Desulfonema ishimotonii]GBC63015.1 hypothetical protein DENIS_4004 [Desulfonema ishimotonii]